MAHVTSATVFLTCTAPGGLDKEFINVHISHVHEWLASAIQVSVDDIRFKGMHEGRLSTVHGISAASLYYLR